MDVRARWLPILLVTGALGLFSLDLEYSPDSLHYLSVARGLVSGWGLAGDLLAVDTPLPRPLDLWPPLFPMAWAALLWLGPDAAVITLHLLCFAVLAAALFSMAPAGQGPRYVWTCAVLIVLYRPFGFVAAAAWSEPLCIALLAVAVALEVRGAGSGPAWGRSFATGALLGLAMLTRYAALFALPGLLLWRFVRAREEPGAARRHVPGVLALGAGLGVVVAPWFIRNVMLFGGVLGPPRAPRGPGLVASLLAGVDTLLGDASFGAFGLLSLMCLLWLLLPPLRGAAVPEPLGALRPAALVAAAYVLGLFWTATRTHTDELDNRLLAPLGVGLLPVTAAVLVSLVERSTLLRAPVLISTGVLVVAGHLWAPLREWVRHPRHGMSHLRERIAPVTSWVETHVTERDLLLGPQLWWVHPFSRAPVVAHGYPERAFMNEETLGPYLKQHGGAYERLYWFGTKPPPVSPEVFEVVEVTRFDGLGPYWGSIWSGVWELRLKD
ncbi:MAG TPA: hypothetical protein VE153_08590 [Myxococcus sp.]|nr:hypothetical protein [Myxococcus sp.]